MTLDEAKIRVEYLREQIVKNSKLYYEEDAPVISDYEYDAMFRELQDAYNIACQYLLENSPYSDELFADWSEESKEELRN